MPPKKSSAVRLNSGARRAAARLSASNHIGNVREGIYARLGRAIPSGFAARSCDAPCMAWGSRTGGRALCPTRASNSKGFAAHSCGVPYGGTQPTLPFTPSRFEFRLSRLNKKDFLSEAFLAPYAGFDTIPRISRSKDSLYETGRPVPDIVSFRIKFSFAMISDNLFVASSILNTFWVAFEKIAKIDCKQSYCWPSSARMSVLYTIIGLTIRWFSQFQAQALTSFMTLLRSLSTLKRKYLIWSCSVNTRHPR